MVNNGEGDEMANKKIGLLDADILAYVVASTHQVKVDWDGDGEISQYVTSLDAAKTKVDKTIGEYMWQLKLDKMIICLTDKHNFRKDILPTYKDNRKATLKPLLLSTLKEYMSSNYESFIRPGLEADDVLGILATHPTLIPGKKVIISIDKDLTQIPGLYFNPDKHTKAVEIKAEDGDYFHLMQTLQGDSVDGYKGCPGIGPKKAEKILADSTDPWGDIVSAYMSKNLTEDDALVQAQVARICQHQNYNYDTAEVIPWTPEELT